MKRYRFTSKKYGLTEFEHVEGQVFITCLFGMQMNRARLDAPARLRGLFSSYILKDGADDAFHLVDIVEKEAALGCVFETPDGALRCLVSFECNEELGIIAQKMEVYNNAACAISVCRMQPRFLFAAGEYEYYAQNSTWCYEGDGAWASLEKGGVCLRNEGGRTTQGNTPFVALRDTAAARGLAFHIIPTGNWEAEFCVSSGGVGPQGAPIPALCLGQASRQFRYSLKAGALLVLPVVLIQALPQGVLHSAAPALHRYLMAKVMLPTKAAPRVVYNPWMDCFDDLDPARLRRQLEVARKLGCEVFVIDAGWFGNSGGWGDNVGDWREKQNGAFMGKMQNFADEVRQSGLAFGLWMEPERVGKGSPAFQAHPEWFAYGSSGGYYPKLWLPEVYSYTKEEIFRVIRTYKLGWIKLDFNIEMDVDAAGTEFLTYYNQLYRLLDEVKQAHPALFIEGCASGGLRSDINTVAHLDAHFTSDNVNPWDALATYEQMAMRLPPGRLYRWLALQRGPDIPAYFRQHSIVETTAVTPCSPGAGFAECEVITPDFACKLVFNAAAGITGDISTLNADECRCISSHIEFYKQWRGFIAGAALHLSAEPAPLGNRQGWHVHQYIGEAKENSLVYVYRLKHPSSEKWVQLREIEQEFTYKITVFGQQQVDIRSGLDLLQNGITITLEKQNSGSILIIQKV